MIDKIAAQSKLLQENMNDIVWSMKPGGTNSTTLEVKVKNFGAELLNDKNIDFTYQISAAAEDILQGIAVRKNILLLIKEAMHNMAKYSQANKARLKLDINGDNLCLEITDNGIGFDTEKVHTGNGLETMRYRAAELKGHIHINSTLNEGTVITAIIPLNTINVID
jgi:signal transduction histidine kinase